jgi:hypothetical protein
MSLRSEDAEEDDKLAASRMFDAEASTGFRPPGLVGVLPEAKRRSDTESVTDDFFG